MQEEFFENAHLTRQLDLIPVDILEEPITIIGAGAIGSFTCLALAKMGFSNITVIDFDKIDVVNMNCQFFRFKDIGKFKVDALRDLVKEFTNVEIVSRNERYESGTFRGIIISCVDNMEVRKTIWNNHKEISVGTKLVIDPRMAIEDVLCYAMNPMDPKDIESYDKSLYSDENAVQERCTAKSVMFTVLSISGHVAKILKDKLTEMPYARTTMWSIKNNAQKCFNKNV
jgi:molybdopterin/thiamine biosynthesis adenylyltransferase